MLDLALLGAKARSAMAGRAFWQVRYDDGKIVSEWECDWSRLSRAGLVEGRLICPNGETAVMGDPRGAGTRLFQFKTAVMTAGVGRSTDGYVMGMLLQGAGGMCRCAAWEPQPGRLLTFDDNVLNMRYRNVGVLSLANLGLSLT